MVDNAHIWRNSTPSNDNCLVKHNTTVFITNVYQGIPETLVLNLISWACLLFLFNILRRRAWNYGRLALVQRSHGRWVNLFYSASDEALSERNNDNASNIDAKCCSWLPLVLRISKEQIRNQCGPDALHYISFQRHLITLSAVITVLSICVILPINFQGKLQGDEKSFGHTTISNLDPDSLWLWVHTIIGIAYLPISVLLMRRCTGRKPGPDSATRTIMITNISKSYRIETSIKEYLQQCHPDIEFLSIKLAYNIKKLTEVNDKRELARQARLYADTYYKKTGIHLTVKPKFCGEKENALDYYAEEEYKYFGETERYRAMAMNEPLGIAFVTVASHQTAEYIITSFRPSTHRDWTLQHAPAPTDLYWEHLGVKQRVWYLKAVVINLIMFIVLFFLTTPAIVVNFMDAFYIKQGQIINNISPVISEFLPTLFLWTMAALLPAIVSFSDKFLSHWTKSQQNFSIMTKTFSFLLLMSLILPSLGLTSAQAFIEWTLQHENSTFRWECVFLPDKGAFFVNYVITSAFIGTSLELIRFPELFLYIWYMLLSRSKAEKANVQKAILYEFPFGVHYAWMLVVFTINVVYSLACPLIAPFGLIYVTLKHIGDKHNICFAYTASNMTGGGGGKIHATAVRLVRVSIILIQIIMAAFAGVRGGFNFRTVTLIFFVFVCLGAFLMLSPFPSCDSVPPLQEDNNLANRDYVADVLTVTNLSAGSPFFMNDYGTVDARENATASPGAVNI